MSPAKRRVFNVSVAVAIFTVIVALVGGAMHAGRGMGQVQDNTDRLKVQEKKIHNIEAVVIRTHTIVTRIDKRMDREHP